MLPDLNIDDDLLSLGRPTTLGADRRVTAVRAGHHVAGDVIPGMDSSEDECKRGQSGSSEDGESGGAQAWATAGQEKVGC